MAQTLTERIQQRPLGVLVSGALAISFAPMLVKSLALGGLDPTAIAFWRCTIGLGFWCIPFILSRKLPRVPAKTMALTALAGVLFALDLWVWHRSIVLAGAGLATILGNTQVFITAVLGIWVFKERPGVGFGRAAAVAFVGVVLLVGIGGDVDLTPDYLRGILYGLFTGLLYGSFIVTMRAAGRGEANEKTANDRLFWFTVWSTLALLVPWLFETQALPADSIAWWKAIGLALLAQALGWWAIGVSLPGVRTSLGGLILLLQPILASVWGVLFFNERWTGLQLVGAILTLGAVYYGSTRRQPREEPVPESHST